MILSRNRLFKLGLLSITALLVAGWFVAANAVDRPKYEIKFASLAPEGTTWMNSMRQLDADVREATDGQVGFRIYPGGVQGDEPDVLRKIRIGQLHATGFTGVGMGEILSDVRVLDVPFLFETKEEVDYILETFTDEFDDAFREKGFVLLGWAEVGWVYFFANKPINSIDDLAGMKIWCWSGDLLPKKMLEGFGVTPVPLAVPEVLTGLQTGMIDAVYSSPMAAVSLQWFTRVKYMNLTPVTNSMGAVLMTTKEFDRIPEEHRQALLRISRERLHELTILSRRDNALSIEEMKKAGVEMLGPLPPNEYVRYEEVGIKVQEDLAGNLYSPELLSRIKQALTEYRSRQGE